LRDIEVTSFVRPKWVPQLSDNIDVMRGPKRRTRVNYSVLAPNIKGFEAAMAAGASELAVFAVASDGFREGTSTVRPTIRSPASRRFSTRPGVRVSRCADMCRASSRVPTTGPSCPRGGRRSLHACMSCAATRCPAATPSAWVLPRVFCACSMPWHGEFRSADLRRTTTKPTASQLPMSTAPCQFGLRVFDSSIAGLGGCPYAARRLPASNDSAGTNSSGLEACPLCLHQILGRPKPTGGRRDIHSEQRDRAIPTLLRPIRA